MSHQTFAVDRWPLFEIRASVLDARNVRLHVSFDLLIADAWSFTILVEQLLALYREPDTVLPRLELSFRDYVLWERRFRLSQRYQTALSYWLNRIESLPEAPESPMIPSAKALAKPHFTRRRGELTRDAWERVKNRAAAASLTPSLCYLPLLPRSWRFGAATCSSVSTLLYSPARRYIRRLIKSLVILHL